MWFNWQSHVPVTIKILPSFLQYFQFFFWVLMLIKRKKKCFHPWLFDITTTYIIIVSSLYMPIKTNYIMFEISFFLVACTWLCICITMHRWVKKEKRKKESDSSQKFENFVFLLLPAKMSETQKLVALILDFQIYKLKIRCTYFMNNWILNSIIRNCLCK